MISTPREETHLRASEPGSAGLSTRGQLYVLAPVIVLAVWATIWVTAKTPHKLATNTDTAVYAGMADEVRTGHGPTVPSTYCYDHFSPHDAVAFHGHIPSTH